MFKITTILVYISIQTILESEYIQEKTAKYKIFLLLIGNQS